MSGLGKNLCFLRGKTDLNNSTMENVKCFVNGSAIAIKIDHFSPGLKTNFPPGLID